MNRVPPTVAMAVLAVMVSMRTPAAAERPVAVFDFELIDTSLEGEMNGRRADEAQRLVRAGGLFGRIVLIPDA